MKTLSEKLRDMAKRSDVPLDVSEVLLNLADIVEQLTREDEYDE